MNQVSITLLHIFRLPKAITENINRRILASAFHQSCRMILIEVLERVLYTHGLLELINELNLGSILTFL